MSNVRQFAKDRDAMLEKRSVDALIDFMENSGYYDKELAETLKNKTKSEQAFAVGEMIGKLATKKGIKTVVFDRGGYLYTGRVMQVAEGARKAGLEF